MLSSIRPLALVLGHPASRAIEPAALLAININHFHLKASNQDQLIAHKGQPKTQFDPKHVIQLNEAAKMRALTPSLVMSTTRLLLTPTIGYMLMNDMHDEALLCFGAAIITDLIEKILPNRTNLDKVMDTMSDKLLTSTCFIALFHLDLITIHFIKIFVARDLAATLISMMIRWNGFTRPPTLKKFFSFNKYPTLGFEPPVSSKIHAIMQYTTIGLLIGTSHLAGTDGQYWLMVALGCMTGISYGMSACGLIYRTYSYSHFVSAKPARLTD